MASTTRSAQFSRLHKTLKKHYTPVEPDAKRSVLEHLLFASCLENAHYTAAEEAFAALVHTFFDLNEIRVSGVRELSEVMSSLPEPAVASHAIKRILQNVFEATYAFDLEELRKQNLGAAVERLEKIEGATKFSIAYVTQSALGGHAIPLDSGTFGALRVVDLVTEAEVTEGVVHGLDRAIPKQSGIEFGSLLHQLGADFTAAQHAPALHAIFLDIDPKSKDRLPSRRAPKRAAGESATSESKPEPEAKSGKHAAESKAEGAKGKTSAPAKGSTKEADAAVEMKKHATAAKKTPLHESDTSTEAPSTHKESPRKKDKVEPEHVPGKLSKKPEVPSKKPVEKKPIEKKRLERGKDKGETSDDEPASTTEGIGKRKPR